MRRVLQTLLVAVLALLLASPAAWAKPEQHSLADVMAALGVRPEPSDYVVVVDESLSMLQENRYGQLRQALTGMMGALAPEDHVALVIFADDAKVVYRGSDKQAALAALPPGPTGNFTDIGAGIDAGLTELERGGASHPSVLVLVTDGIQDAPAGSPFAEPRSPAWQKLRERADKLDADRDLAAYSIGLGGETDAGLLSDVIPGAVMVPGGSIGKHLAEIDHELLTFRAAERLRPDATGAVTATWNDLDETALALSGRSNATLTLQSGMKSAPVQVSGFALKANKIAKPTANLPTAVTLAPGESVDIPVELVSEVQGGASFTLTAKVESPWQDAMGQLGLEFAPKWASEKVSFTATPQPEPTTPQREPAQFRIPSNLIPWLAGGGAILLLVGLRALVLALQPRLTGSILISKGQEPLHEFLLGGRRVFLAEAAGAIIPGVSGHCAAGRQANGGRGVTVVARLGGKRIKAQLTDGETMALGDHTLTYTALNTRSMDMVTSGLADDDAPGDLNQQATPSQANG